MLSAYRQVARIYLRAPLTSLSKGMFFVMGLFSLTIALLMRRPHFDTVLSPVAMGMLFLSLSVWLSFYEQVVSIRLRLWPDFVRLQLLIFIGIASSLMVLGVLTLSRYANASLIGIVALNAGLFAMVGMMLALQSVLAAIIGMACYFWVLFGSGMTFANAIFAGQLPNISWAIVIGSFVLIVLVLAPFFALNEESRTYRPTIVLDTLSLGKPRMTGEVNRVWARMNETGFWSYVLPHPRPPTNLSNSRRDRIRRWQLQENLQFLALSVYAVGGAIFMTWLLHTGTSPFESIPNFTIPLLVTMASALWQIRWRYIETELLRPVARGDFFKEQGLAMMVYFLVAFVGGLIAMVLPIVLWSRPNLKALPLMLNGLMQLAIVIFSFGLSAWILRYRSIGPFSIVLAMLWPLTWVQNLPSEVPQLAIAGQCGLAAVIAAIGIALAIRAYRLWLTTELG